jgi:2'-5' RNA ligase
MSVGATDAVRFRLFLAGTLPADFIEQVVDQLGSVRAVYPQIKWTAAETLHLTLVFLGSVEETHLPGLTHDLTEVAHRHRPVGLQLSGMETFGPPRAPRVLAASLAGEIDGLQALVEDARRRLAAFLPPEPERPFRPHLTVARSRSHGGDPMLGRCRAALTQSVTGAFRLERIGLFRSETRPGGAVHTALQTWTLGG